MSRDISETLIRVLQKSDDVALPESGIYFDALEARIMGALDAAIESGEVENRDRRDRAAVQEISRPINNQSAQRRALAIRAGQMVMFLGVGIVITGKWLASSRTTQSPSSVSLLHATRTAAPKVLTGTVISYESTTDLALEIAARRLVAYHKGE